MTPQRKKLHAYTEAASQIVLAGAAIRVLERMAGNTPLRLIKSLEYEQQRALKRMDAAAAALGAPYPMKQKPPGCTKVKLSSAQQQGLTSKASHIPGIKGE